MNDAAAAEQNESRWLVSVLLAMFVILTISGCSPARKESATGPVLPLLDQARGESNMALLAGELVVVGRCLYLVNDDDIKWLLVFPADAVAWERDTLVLGGERIAVGETVTVGGGERQNLSALRFVREPDESCDAANIWVASQLGP